MKFTFKKRKRETGLRAVGYPHANVDIKLGGLKVGYISAPNWRTKDNKWAIQLAVKKCSHPETSSGSLVDWGWATLQGRFDSERAARDFLQSNCDLLSKWHLHKFPKEDE